MSQKIDTHLNPLDGQPIASSRLTRALALGIGLAAPTTGEAVIAPCAPLPHTVGVGGICSLDVNGDNLPDIQVLVNSTDGSLQSLLASVNLLDSPTSKLLLQLHAGDHVGAAIFAANRGDTIGFAYISSAGAWDQIGETGFAAFRIGTAGNENYGWIQLTRGSLTVGSFGYQSTLNADAVIPGAVPEPGSLLLVATGAAGIAALRRRRATAAQASR
jgi:hypothetical protein